jgi:hypothetical protein
MIEVIAGMLAVGAIGLAAYSIRRELKMRERMGEHAERATRRSAEK